MNKYLLFLIAAAGFGAYKYGFFDALKNPASAAQVVYVGTAQDQRHQRISSIVGCSADAGRENCRCYDKTGSIDTVLNRDQCLAVVDRGLAALKDF